MTFAGKDQLVRTALAEDYGHGDATSRAVIDHTAQMQAIFAARQPGVLAGLETALMAFSIMDSTIEIERHSHDGACLEAGTNIATVRGPARSILAAERTALNLLTHLSGIASLAAQYSAAIAHTKAKIVDTRKTLPGLRHLQKEAVTAGGGVNHRTGLDDGILIKDNHIAMAGGIETALTRAVNNAGYLLKIQIEVDTLAQLEQVLNHGGADAVLLDNMDIATLKQAVDMIDKRLRVEASGGITLDNVSEIAGTGVDYISIGALTNSAPALDIGLDNA